MKTELYFDANEPDWLLVDGDVGRIVKSHSQFEPTLISKSNRVVLAYQPAELNQVRNWLQRGLHRMGPGTGTFLAWTSKRAKR